MDTLVDSLCCSNTRTSQRSSKSSGFLVTRAAPRSIREAAPHRSGPNSQRDPRRAREATACEPAGALVGEKLSDELGAKSSSWPYFRIASNTFRTFCMEL